MAALPASAFNCVLFGACETCRFLKWGFCPSKDHPLSFLSVADANNNGYSCHIPGCPGRLVSNGGAARYGASAAAGGGAGKSAKKGSFFSKKSSDKLGGGCVCEEPVVQWRPGLFSNEDIVFAAKGLLQHPRIKELGILRHAIIQCELCLTISFPGTFGVLTEFDSATQMLLDIRGERKPISSWSGTHMHVAGCDGLGNPNALMAWPVGLTDTVFMSLPKAIAMTPKGPWNNGVGLAAITPSSSRGSSSPSSLSGSLQRSHSERSGRPESFQPAASTLPLPAGRVTDEAYQSFTSGPPSRQPQPSTLDRPTAVRIGATAPSLRVTMSDTSMPTVPPSPSAPSPSAPSPFTPGGVPVFPPRTGLAMSPAPAPAPVPVPSPRTTAPVPLPRAPAPPPPASDDLPAYSLEDVHSRSGGRVVVSQQARGPFSLWHPCSVCSAERELVAFYPCGHVLACYFCAHQALLSGQGCRRCQSEVVSVLKLHAPV